MPSEISFDPTDEALVRRLRRLSWPTVDAEVRDRCWETFAARLENGEPLSELPEPRSSGPCTDQDGRDTVRRESYTRRQLLPRDPLRGYDRVSRRWAEHPSRRIAALSR